ncbi:MAG: transglutaminase-like domain-containing protein [Actinomycetota bacterium]|nr:transglutaminase-like domain-containing protein [Actinomycetota bacterium]
MSASSRARFAEVVRTDPVDLALACLLVAAEVEPDLDPAPYLAQLDGLARDARGDVEPGARPAQAADGLRRALGARAGFGGTGEDYLDIRSSLLPEVLTRRRGLPILLSVVWLEVARRLAVPAYGVGLPGHFVVAVGPPNGEHQLVDPFAGGRLLSEPDAERLVHETTGRELTRSDLEPRAPADILLRVLANLRARGADGDRSIETARARLWAVELSLLLPRHPAGLRGERGELLARLGDYAGGAAELDAYAEAIAPVDPSTAETALRQARMARARLN